MALPHTTPAPRPGSPSSTHALHLTPIPSWHHNWKQEVEQAFGLGSGTGLSLGWGVSVGAWLSPELALSWGMGGAMRFGTGLRRTPTPFPMRDDGAEAREERLRRRFRCGARERERGGKDASAVAGIAAWVEDVGRAERGEGKLKMRAKRAWGAVSGRAKIVVGEGVGRARGMRRRMGERVRRWREGVGREGWEGEMEMEMAALKARAMEEEEEEEEEEFYDEDEEGEVWGGRS